MKHKNGTYLAVYKILNAAHKHPNNSSTSRLICFGEENSLHRMALASYGKGSPLYKSGLLKALLDIKGSIRAAAKFDQMCLENNSEPNHRTHPELFSSAAHYEPGMMPDEARHKAQKLLDEYESRSRDTTKFVSQWVTTLSFLPHEESRVVWYPKLREAADQALIRRQRAQAMGWLRQRWPTERRDQGGPPVPLRRAEGSTGKTNV